MFSKAKRFELNAKNQAKASIKTNESAKNNSKPETISFENNIKTSKSVSGKKYDTSSQCGSIKSTRSLVTPKPIKSTPSTKIQTSVKKPLSTPCSKLLKKQPLTLSEDIAKAQLVEISNKDHTIAEYKRQIEELKTKVVKLQHQLHPSKNKDYLKDLNLKVSQLDINDWVNTPKENANNLEFETKVINDLKNKITALEQQCETLEQEVSLKQVELTSLEEVICIRDSLCKDLQNKLSEMETALEETKQRLEMVKGHHALALEANESIRREYKAELDVMKNKLEEEKQSLIFKCKADQEELKLKYQNQIELIKTELLKEKDEVVAELQAQLLCKDAEMKAKLEQIEEATNEKVKLCEIQFEERCQSIQEHWSTQEEKIEDLEKETTDLKYSLSLAEDQTQLLEKEINILQQNNNLLATEKSKLEAEVENLKELSKKKYIDFENHINKLTFEVDKAVKEKNKYELSLSVTRDIVQVLTMRLRESDDEVENLDTKVQLLTEEKKDLESTLENYKNSLEKTIVECNEYQEALVNILKSKAALAKEHNRIMEHNVSLIESLQNVETEAYRELGSIKNELIEDVELLKKESAYQIKKLREDLDMKQEQYESARKSATAAAAAEARVKEELATIKKQLETADQQIQDQQSLVVELSLLRQENEELSMSVHQQSLLIEKLKKDKEQNLIKPKSPSVMRKPHKLGKENAPLVISPLRERNH